MYICCLESHLFVICDDSCIVWIYSFDVWITFIYMPSESGLCAFWIRLCAFWIQLCVFQDNVYILMYNLDQDTFFSGLMISSIVWISLMCCLDHFHKLSGLF